MLLLLAALACNDAPEGLSVALSPEAPSTLDDLELDVSVSDPDEQEVALEIQWTRDGQAMPELDGETLVPAEQTAKGELWEAQVVASDGELSVGPVSDSVEIGNTEPVLSGITITPQDPSVLSALQVSFEQKDIDGDELSAEVLWFVDEVEVASGLALAPGSAQKGQSVRAEVTLSDGEASVSGSAEVVIVNTPPGPPSLLLSPETSVRVGESDLYCEVIYEGLDVDQDALATEILWTVDETDWTGVVSTQVHPGDTLPAENLEGGQLWSCSARSNDGEAMSPWVDSAQVEVLSCVELSTSIQAGESACNSESNGLTWQDNRVRAYNNSSGTDITGWMHFDLSALPPDAEVTEATVQLYEEWGYTSGTPEMVFVESDDDDWTRGSITGTTPARGATISESYTRFMIGGWNTFELDLGLWDWSADLSSGVATLGIDNADPNAGYVYFHGPDTAGQEPLLELSYLVCE